MGSYWMDLSMNRVSIWIHRSSENENWQNVNSQNPCALFITDSFTFINNELDAFFDHLSHFPAEGMSLANVFFARLQFLVETILHITECALKDVTVLDNECLAAKQRKNTRLNVRGEANKMTQQFDELGHGLLKKEKRRKLQSAFVGNFHSELDESMARGKDILNKFRQINEQNEEKNDA